jgi:broad specificity phosphatase PhoE
MRFAVYASDALRAQQTAEVIAAALELNVTVVPGLSEVALGTAEGSTDPAIHRHTAEVLKSWIVDGDLSARMADGESGNDVAVRMTAALTQIAADCVGAAAIVVGHVASLTIGVSELCRNGPALWGQPLPHATVFPLIREEANWHVNWPG